MVPPSGVADTAVLVVFGGLAPLLEPHPRVVAHLHRPLAEDQRDAGDDEEAGRHYRGDEELVVRLLQAEPSHHGVRVLL